MSHQGAMTPAARDDAPMTDEITNYANYGDIFMVGLNALSP